MSIVKSMVNGSAQIPYLVIGYGNTLRCDDGAGYRIAETVAEWDLPGVRSLPCHQLIPELCEAIAQSNIVIFVDAAIVPEPISEIALRSLQPDLTDSFTAHYASPEALLAMVSQLYQVTPTAYQILIPAIDLAFGESFSNVTENYVHIALEKIRQFVG